MPRKWLFATVATAAVAGVLAIPTAAPVPPAGLPHPATLHARPRLHPGGDQLGDERRREQQPPRGPTRHGGNLRELMERRAEPDL